MMTAIQQVASPAVGGVRIVDEDGNVQVGNVLFDYVEGFAVGLQAEFTPSGAIARRRRSPSIGSRSSSGRTRVVARSSR